MSGKAKPLTRALSGIATFAMLLSGLTIGTALAAAADDPPVPTPELVYDSIPDVSPPSYPSQAFQATQTVEFGDYVVLAGTQRTISSVTVGLTNWACEEGAWMSYAEPCVTTPGSTFSHPITLNVYEVDQSGATPQPGALAASVTQVVDVPFRPSADLENCTDKRWWDGEVCSNGFAFNATFDLSTEAPLMTDDVIVTVGFNTQTYGPDPIGEAGPYNYLNVSLSTIAPTLGTDENPDEMVSDTTYPGTPVPGELATQSDWAPYSMVMEVTADDSLLEAPTEEVTVYQKDVKPTENEDTYQDWHEGKPAPGYQVRPDGLNLGVPTASTIIKGTNVPEAEVTEAELRELIAKASVEVTEGTVTLQVPIHFGITPADNFTTLRSLSLAAGTHDDFALTDTWATTRVIAGSPFNTVHYEAPLGDLIDYIFENFDHVWLGGFGVQADSLAVVPTLVWDDTTYTFYQPEIDSDCVVTSGPAATNLDSSGWTFGKTGADGSNEFVDGGILISSTSQTAEGKAAGNYAVDMSLGEVGVPKLHFEDHPGIEPGIHLSVDFDGNGSVDGVLVGETAYGDNYWLDHSTPGGFVETGAPNTGGGSGSSWYGTLDEWLVSFPEARVLSLGYSLGSHVEGEWLISSIEFGCESYTFDQVAPPAAGATETVTNHDIRPNEDTYAGWHEGYVNDERAYSVDENGLQLADGAPSQIINGLDAALTTTELESFITGASFEVVEGEVTLQVPVFYGPNQDFTTLRSQGMPVGTNGVSVSDLWTTSSAIKDAEGDPVVYNGDEVTAGSKLPLADLVSLLNAQGDVQLLAFGVLSSAPAAIASLTWDGTEYVFEPIDVPAPTQVRVFEDEIALDELGAYEGWHEGYNDNDNENPAFHVTEAGLVLGDGAHSQIIKGLAAEQTDPSVGLLIDGASVTVVDGEVNYQVPIFYGDGNDFTTLRSEQLSGGATYEFDLTSQWTASSTIAGTDIVAGQFMALGDLLDDLSNVRVLAFGVQADSEATVSSIVYDGTEYVFAGPIENETLPSFTGTLKVGETLTADSGTWAPTGTTYTYQWRADGTAIDDATGQSYELTADEFGTTIAVLVTAHKDGYDSVSQVSPGVGQVAAGDLTVGTVVVSGAPQVGGELTADPGAWGPVDVDFAYQWFSDGVAIDGATSPTYTPVIGDIGSTLSVEVTGTAYGYNSSTASAGAGQVYSSAIVLEEPSISGTPQVGEVLTADPGSWFPGTTTFEYQWRADNIEIAGATGATYTPVAGDVDKDISVTVTGTAPSATPVAVTSATVGPVILGDLDVGTPTIGGTPVVGGTLTADAGAWGPAPVELSYQWQADLINIDGATSEEYVLTADEVGASIRVVVTGTKEGYNSAVANSGGTDAVAEGTLTTAVPTISGTPKVGVELTADEGAWEPEGIGFSYQWYADGAEVGTDSVTYTPSAAEAGTVITVAVTGSLDGYTDATATSAETVVVADGDQSGTITFSGDLVFGETLTAVETGWDDATLSYEWFVDGASVGTGETYELAADDVDGMVTVGVTAVRAGYSDASQLSDAQGPVEAATMTPSTPTIDDTSPRVGEVLSALVGPWVPGAADFDYQWLANGDDIVGATGSTYTVVAGDVGDAISVRITGILAGYETTSATSDETSVVANGDIETERISGASRYETAVEISQEFEPGDVDRVYLASGANYADALSAGPAAAHFGGPLLLTAPNTLPDAVVEELERLEPSEVVIVGGTGAVSNIVAMHVDNLVPTVIRLGGANRYETSRLIVDDAFGASGADTAYIATGSNFPDALSAGPAAAHFDGPVILVPGSTSSVGSATLNLLDNLGVDTVKIAGGTGVVSVAIESQLNGELGTANVDRNSGASRYETAIAINADEFTSAPLAYLATGDGFADALAGTALAGNNGAPLFVSPSTCIPQGVLDALNALGTSTLVLLGGTGVLNADVATLEACN